MPYLFFFVVALFAGCSASNEARRDADGGEERCGPVVCDEGQVCCNESCGICAPPDGFCLPTLCDDAPLCEPMDATSVGACELFLGYAFDGSACVALSGCSCSGVDCDDLFEDLVQCESRCVESEVGDSCGGFTGAACSPGFFCDYDEVGGEACMGGGVCERFDPSECVSPGVEVCGCDYQTYASRCAAHAAGTDVLHDGPCPS